MTAFPVGQKRDAVIGDVQLLSGNPVFSCRGLSVVIYGENDVNRWRGPRHRVAVTIRECLKRRLQSRRTIGFKYNADPEYDCTSEETAWHGVPVCYPILGVQNVSGRAIS